VVVVAGGAVDTGGGLATAESTVAQRNVDPAYSNNKNRHSPYLPSEQGTTAAPYQPPCCKSMATTQNPPNPTQIPLDIHKSPPKSPSISQQMRQTSDQGRKSTNAHTSRALAMIEDTKQANQRGGDDAQGWGTAER